MRPQRSIADWVLEAAALMALIAMIALVVGHWSEISFRPRLFPRGPRPWNPRIVLEIMTALGASTYALLSLAGQFQGLIRLPEEIDRDAPQVRQLLLSMMIVLKAVLMIFFVYLSWTLIQVVTGHSRGLHPAYLTLFTALVPLPLILYTVKLRRYRK